MNCYNERQLQNEKIIKEKNNREKRKMLRQVQKLIKKSNNITRSLKKRCQRTEEKR